MEETVYWSDCLDVFEPEYCELSGNGHGCKYKNKCHIYDEIKNHPKTKVVKDEMELHIK